MNASRRSPAQALALVLALAPAALPAPSPAEGGAQEPAAAVPAALANESGFLLEAPPGDGGGGWWVFLRSRALGEAIRTALRTGGRRFPGADRVRGLSMARPVASPTGTALHAELSLSLTDGGTDYDGVRCHLFYSRLVPRRMLLHSCSHGAVPFRAGETLADLSPFLDDLAVVPDPAP